MYKCVLTVCLVIVMNIPLAFAGSFAELPKELFLLETRRRMEMQSSFADLRGMVTHLRKNQGGAVYYPIRLLIRFDREQLNARVKVGSVEVHEFKQNNRTRASEISCNTELSESILNRIGIRIEDLTMSFLDYPVMREFASETIKTVKCRVFELRSPEGEPIKIWVASEYLFPVKVEFFGVNGSVENSPARSLEITGFKKVNQYYAATDIALFSKEFRTRIAFDNCEVLASDDPRAVREFKQ